MPPAEEQRPDLSYASMFGQRNSLNNDPNSSTEQPQVKSAFRLFAPSLQEAWAFEFEQHRLKCGESSPLRCCRTLYESWCERYNFTPGPDTQSYEAMNEEKDLNIIPLDLLRKLIAKFTQDAEFVMEQFRSLRVGMNIPEHECGTALHHLPLERQKEVKEKLLNSIPHPGTLPPEMWDRFPGAIQKTAAPSIDTRGIDTFLRIVRALVAFGMPTYLRDENMGTESVSLAIEDSVWTDIGKEAVDDWVLKARLLSFNHASIAAYLREHDEAGLCFMSARNSYLSSDREDRLTHQHIMPSTHQNARSIGYFSSYPQREPGTKVEIIDDDEVTIIKISPQHEEQSSNATLQQTLDVFCRIREKDGGQQRLFDFPDFIFVYCGGGLGQRCSHFAHVNAISYHEGPGFSHLSCLYELKIAWRKFYQGPPGQTQYEDCHIYDSERYQSQLRQSALGAVDDESWTYDTSPRDHKFVLFYRRVGSELNEPGFLKDWESDPEFKNMYPDLGTGSGAE